MAPRFLDIDMSCDYDSMPAHDFALTAAQAVDIWIENSKDPLQFAKAIFRIASVRSIPDAAPASAPTLGCGDPDWQARHAAKDGRDDFQFRALFARAHPQPMPQKDAARDVLAERQRQVEVEGWTTEHDDGANDVAAMADAAACYAMHAGQMLAGAYSTPCLQPHSLWPWDASWWKPTTPRRDLVKAGALILAEIERIDRIAEIERSRRAKDE